MNFSIGTSNFTCRINFFVFFFKNVTEIDALGTDVAVSDHEVLKHPWRLQQ